MGGRACARESLVQRDCTPNAWAFFLFPVPRDTGMEHQALETVAPSQPGGWRVGSPARVGWASCGTEAGAEEGDPGSWLSEPREAGLPRGAAGMPAST